MMQARRAAPGHSGEPSNNLPARRRERSASHKQGGPNRCTAPLQGQAAPLKFPDCSLMITVDLASASFSFATCFTPSFQQICIELRRTSPNGAQLDPHPPSLIYRTKHGKPQSQAVAARDLNFARGHRRPIAPNRLYIEQRSGRHHEPTYRERPDVAHADAWHDSPTAPRRAHKLPPGAVAGQGQHPEGRRGGWPALRLRQHRLREVRPLSTRSRLVLTGLGSK